eukprot:CAMPEP_0172749616 /NCGR_PEP_ID=MMETSP1074-20121228/147804_1 /TAXON_ID=2916 /ORGANISM="Ceratium fusus, Strain PA161109" /LENGTH=104 /DNA_ID=CAMNT_0013581609 /DNA_START=88 /DNA_END=402 /DNA_ORIENTATION=+
MPPTPHAPQDSRNHLGRQPAGHGILSNAPCPHQAEHRLLPHQQQSRHRLWPLCVSLQKAVRPPGQAATIHFHHRPPTQVYQGAPSALHPHSTGRGPPKNSQNYP